MALLERVASVESCHHERDYFNVFRVMKIFVFCHRGGYCFAHGSGTSELSAWLIRNNDIGMYTRRLIRLFERSRGILPLGFSHVWYIGTWCICLMLILSDKYSSMFQENISDYRGRIKLLGTGIVFSNTWYGSTEKLHQSCRANHIK